MAQWRLIVGPQDGDTEQSAGSFWDLRTGERGRVPTHYGASGRGTGQSADSLRDLRTGLSAGSLWDLRTGHMPECRLITARQGGAQGKVPAHCGTSGRGHMAVCWLIVGPQGGGTWQSDDSLWDLMTGSPDRVLAHCGTSGRGHVAE